MRTRRSKVDYRTDEETIVKRIKTEPVSELDDPPPNDEPDPPSSTAQPLKWLEENKENIPPELLQKIASNDNENVNEDSQNGEALPIQIASDDNGIVDESLIQLANLIASTEPSLMENWDSNARYSLTFDECGQINFQKEPPVHVATPYPSKGLCTTSADLSSSIQTLTPECRALFDATFDSEQPTVIYATASTPLSIRSSTSTDNSGKRQRQGPSGDTYKEKAYNPSIHSRNSHNEKERRRRSRMKYSCQMLRKLVPGVADKTDKATVLEHAVHYLLHLRRCPTVQCDDYLPKIPPPVITKLHYIQTSKELKPNVKQIKTEEQSQCDVADDTMTTLVDDKASEVNDSDDTDSDEDYVNM